MTKKEAAFLEKYTPIKIEDIYPNHPGKEQYFVVCDEEAIEPEFNEILDIYRPFSIISTEMASMLFKWEKHDKSLFRKAQRHEMPYEPEKIDFLARLNGALSKSPEDELLNKDAARIYEFLNDALAGLPAAQKRRIKMRYYQSMTLKEIAEKETVSVVSVRRTINFGLHNIRKKLSKARDEYEY